jgi:hypothetical protein
MHPPMTSLQKRFQAFKESQQAERTAIALTGKRPGYDSKSGKLSTSWLQVCLPIHKLENRQTWFQRFWFFWKQASSLFTIAKPYMTYWMCQGEAMQYSWFIKIDSQYFFLPNLQYIRLLSSIKIIWQSNFPIFIFYFVLVVCFVHPTAARGAQPTHYTPTQQDYMPNTKDAAYVRNKVRAARQAQVLRKCEELGPSGTAPGHACVMPRSSRDHRLQGAGTVQPPHHHYTRTHHEGRRAKRRHSPDFIAAAAGA